MKKIHVLLCCGAGMSSGFLAQKTRQSAKKQQLDLQIEARSESEVAQYLATIDMLMLGPHYAASLENFQAMAQPYNIPVMIIPQTIYATLDGAGMVDLILETVQHKGAE